MKRAKILLVKLSAEWARTMKKMPSNFSECVGSTLCSDHAVSAACDPDLFPGIHGKFGGVQQGVYALGKIVFVESEGLKLSVQSGS